MTKTRMITSALLALLMTSAVAFAQQEQKPSDQPVAQTQPAKPLATPAGEATQAEPAKEDPAVNKLVEQLVAKWKDHKSMSADMHIDMAAEQGGQKLSVEGTGRCEIARTDDSKKVRFELTQNMKMGEGDAAMEMERKLITIDNGTVVYTMVEQMGQKQVYKANSGDQNIPQFGGDSMFEALRAENSLKVLPDEKVDGKDVAVIEATPRQQNPGVRIAKSVLYFDKDLGAMVRMESFDPSGQKVQTVTFNDVKLNPDLAADRFEFEVPEGVQVIDQTTG